MIIAITMSRNWRDEIKKNFFLLIFSSSWKFLIIHRRLRYEAACGNFGKTQLSDRLLNSFGLKYQELIRRPLYIKLFVIYYLYWFQFHVSRCRLHNRSKQGTRSGIKAQTGFNPLIIRSRFFSAQLFQLNHYWLLPFSRTSTSVLPYRNVSFPIK